jgi:hypothetical protein
MSEQQTAFGHANLLTVSLRAHPAARVQFGATIARWHTREATDPSNE